MTDIGTSLQATQLLIAGAPNFRDLGGYETADGRRVRHGVLYRSEALALSDASDRAALAGLGIRFVCDLRSAHERETAPTAWPPDRAPETLHLDVGMDLRAGNAALVRILAADPTVRGVRAMLMASYGAMPRAFAPGLRGFLDALLSEKLPALFHCTAGKDRTGFLGAVLLETLGVPRETIRYDYALTSRYSDMPRMMRTAAVYVAALTGRDDHGADMLETLCGTDPDYIESSFAAIARDWGSTEAYLRAVAGFGAPERTRLRDLLLT
jgi:protein-tyrosine phosphatase